MFQYRPPDAGNRPMYEPRRDINYLMPHLIAKVPLQVVQGACKHTQAMCYAHGVTEDDLIKAVTCYADFLGHAHEPEYGPKVYDALQRSGWADCHPIARIAVLQYISQTMTYTIWKTIREATKVDGPSVAPLRDLIAWTDEAVRYAGMSWWQRLVYRWRRFFDSSMKHIETQW